MLFRSIVKMKENSKYRTLKQILSKPRGYVDLSLPHTRSTSSIEAGGRVSRQRVAASISQARRAMADSSRRTAAMADQWTTAAMFADVDCGIKQTVADAACVRLTGNDEDHGQSNLEENKLFMDFYRLDKDVFSMVDNDIKTSIQNTWSQQALANKQDRDKISDQLLIDTSKLKMHHHNMHQTQKQRKQMVSVQASVNFFRKYQVMLEKGRNMSKRPVIKEAYELDIKALENGVGKFYAKRERDRKAEEKREKDLDERIKKIKAGKADATHNEFKAVLRSFQKIERVKEKLEEHSYNLSISPKSCFNQRRGFAKQQSNFSNNHLSTGTEQTPVKRGSLVIEVDEQDERVSNLNSKTIDETNSMPRIYLTKDRDCRSLATSQIKLKKHFSMSKTELEVLKIAFRPEMSMPVIKGKNQNKVNFGKTDLFIKDQSSPSKIFRTQARAGRFNSSDYHTEGSYKLQSAFKNEYTKSVDNVSMTVKSVLQSVKDIEKSVSYCKSKLERSLDQDKSAQMIREHLGEDDPDQMDYELKDLVYKNKKKSDIIINPQMHNLLSDQEVAKLIHLTSKRSTRHGASIRYTKKQMEFMNEMPDQRINE